MNIKSFIVGTVIVLTPSLSGAQEKEPLVFDSDDMDYAYSVGYRQALKELYILCSTEFKFVLESNDGDKVFNCFEIKDNGQRL